MIEKPPICGKELVPLTLVQLAGFRLHPGVPVSRSIQIQMNNYQLFSIFSFPKNIEFLIQRLHASTKRRIKNTSMITTVWLRIYRQTSRLAIHMRRSTKKESDMMTTKRGRNERRRKSEKSNRSTLRSIHQKHLNLIRYIFFLNFKN